MQPANRWRAVGAFTLIELLIVIAVVTLVMGILLPSLRKGREQARRVICLSHLKQIAHGTSMYLTDHNEMVPLGPSDMLNVQQTQSGRVVTNLTTCHWGGRRAGWLHGPDPEKEKRPLTAYLYRDASLDMQTPVFRCPSDRPTEWSDSLMPGSPIYEVCGNSYYLNMFGEIERQHRLSSTSTSRVIVYLEAPLHELFAKASQGMGWHGQFSTHNVVFLDMHAEGLYIDSRQRKAPDWNVSDFIAMNGFLE